VWAVVVVVAVGTAGSLATFLPARAVGGIAQFGGLTGSSAPFDVAVGQNGQIFFTERSADKIGRMSLSGAVSEFSIPTASSAPTGIVAGPDGDIWFSESGQAKVGRMTTDGVFSEIALAAGSVPDGITVGSDANIWFADTGLDKVGRISVGSLQVSEFGGLSGAPKDIAAGADGNLWLTEPAGARIARLSTAGSVVDEFVVPANGTSTVAPYDVAAGPDANMWFTDTSGRVGKVTAAGTFTMYALSAGAVPHGITAGEDGALWFADSHLNELGRITTTGTTTAYGIATGPEDVTAATDGNVWVTEAGANEVGRLAAAATNRSYVLARSDGFVGGTLSAPSGRVVLWSFMGSTAQNVTDSTGMGLFASGSRSPVGYYSFVFNAAGTYPYTDTLHPAVTATISVPMTAAPGPTAGTYTLTWASAAPATNFVFDVQMKAPGATTWTALVSGTTATAQTFTPSAGSGTYQFQARLRSTANGHMSNWSPTLALCCGNWPTFLYDNLHSGVSPDPALGATAAPGLALRWKTSVGAAQAPVKSSPAVAYNPTRAKTLVYAATSSGTIDAIDLATGAIIWTTSGYGAIYSSPVVAANTVYVGTATNLGTNGQLVALDATTGQLQCTFVAHGRIFDPPVVGQIDTTGPVVFFGDSGISETSNAGHEWAINGVGNTAGACTQRWVFNAWNNSGTNHSDTGSWSPPALATDSTGRPLVVMGSSQPDDSVYALDARTGAKVWRFQTQIGNDTDVGAGPTISPPGYNGFAHGVVYIDGKDFIEYALDLLNGTKIWEFNLQTHSGGITAENEQSTAAFTLGRVIVPYAGYLFSINPNTGAQMWRSPSATGQYFSSPIVSGAVGDRVILLGDDANTEHAYRLDDGTPLFAYTTGGPIYSSTAIASGTMLFGSNDGYLYALG
jgi:streptogramin lyase/outer membrane protein assembly factor BamB